MSFNTYYFNYYRLSPLPTDFIERLREVPLHQKVLQFQSLQITALDLWTLIPPNMLSSSTTASIVRRVPTFKPGFLSDSVRMFMFMSPLTATIYSV